MNGVGCAVNGVGCVVNGVQLDDVLLLGCQNCAVFNRSFPCVGFCHLLETSLL